MPVTTEYQVQFEVCALLFLLAVTARFFSVRRFPSLQNSLFGVILICAIADISLDVLGSYTIYKANVVPVWLNYLINTVFYALQIVFPALMMSYVIFCSGRTFRTHKLLRVLLIPSGVFVLSLLANLFTGWIFSLPVLNGVRVYCHGPYFTLLYIGTAFYMMGTLALVHYYRADLNERQRRTIIQFMFIIAAALVIQFFFPSILLTGVAMVLAILMMFFTLQNPDDMLDVISGAFNYNAMIILLDTAIAKGDTLYVITVDIGGIRRVNSTFGVIIGNRIFAQAGAFLNGLEGNNWVFRMVGTRFMVTATSEKSYRAAVEEIRGRFEREWIVDDNVIHLSATIRYFNAQGIFESSEEVIGLIDETYAGIGAGHWGQCQPIDRAALESAHRVTRVENAIRSALRAGKGFSLHYQPIFHTKTKRFTSAEALLRLEDPELGCVSPAEFIPIAEKNGTILQIDDLVVRAACDFLARNPQVKLMEINLSASEFFQNPMERIHAIVLQSGVDPRRICFEVTETAADIYPAMLEEFMNGMIALGYRFALDDFGTGYSNITKAVNLPFSIAKIDRVLLKDSHKIKQLFDALAGMFRSIGVDTVVEGVETEERAKQVSSKVDFIQGFLYARPMPEKEFLAFWRKECL